jgi:hypothetical protein
MVDSDECGVWTERDAAWWEKQNKGWFVASAWRGYNHPMPNYRDISTIWKNIKEFELQPIRQAALRELKIVLIGATGSGRHTLGTQMRTDPVKPELYSQSPLTILDLDDSAQADRADLIILVRMSPNKRSRWRCPCASGADAGKRSSFLQQGRYPG